jgi:twitching motility protein PilT
VFFYYPLIPLPETMAIQKLEEIVRQALQLGASDIHLGVGDKPAVRVNKIIQFLNEKELTSEEVDSIGRDLLGDSRFEQLQNNKDQLISWETSQGERFRIKFYTDRKGINAALRHLRREMPSIDSLGLPQVLKDLVQKPHGLLLIIGPTGNGKTTTRTALINHINETQQKHIISIEGTVEYIFENKKSLVQQRSVGLNGNASSYPEAIKSAMHEDPDIISLGDLLDKEAVEAALNAAQTGHLVIAEMHANSTYHAINRILSMFPSNMFIIQEQLAQQLIGAVAQRLIKKDNSLMLGTEMLVSNNAIKSIIRQGQTELISDAIKSGGSMGMHLLDDHIKFILDEEVSITN